MLKKTIIKNSVIKKFTDLGKGKGMAQLNPPYVRDNDTMMPIS